MLFPRQPAPRPYSILSDPSYQQPAALKRHERHFEQKNDLPARDTQHRLFSTGLAGQTAYRQCISLSQNRVFQENSALFPWIF